MRGLALFPSWWQRPPDPRHTFVSNEVNTNVRTSPGAFVSVSVIPLEYIYQQHQQSTFTTLSLAIMHLSSLSMMGVYVH